MPGLSSGAVLLSTAPLSRPLHLSHPNGREIRQAFSPPDLGCASSFAPRRQGSVCREIPTPEPTAGDERRLETERRAELQAMRTYIGAETLITGAKVRKTILA
jgi:hypothetical protein